MNKKYFRLTINPEYTTTFTVDKESIEVYTKPQHNTQGRRILENEEFGTKIIPAFFKNKNGDFLVSIDVSPLSIGNHILNVVPKPSSPPMLPKSTIFEVFDLSSTIETAKEAKENAKSLNTASTTSEGGISLLTIIGTICSSLFSYSAILKVGLTIKLL